MKNFKKIAIIGVSGKFAYTDCLKDMDRVFKEHIDTVHSYDKERLILEGLSADSKQRECSYIDDVDIFDYEQFGISKHDADYMCPQHRLAIEYVKQLFENAGYSKESMRGSNTSLFVSVHDSGYSLINKSKDSSASLIGSFDDMIVGRISYIFDLHGEASLVNTACSSSLYGISLACKSLILQDCETAIAGAVTIDLRSKPIEYDDVIGIDSSDGRCLTFDENANGVGFGEGIGFILLKLYDNAIRDNDNILAIITTVGVNQDGGRSNSMTAPSAKAQAKLLEDTWKSANISPEDIGYFEAHGTGTKIGDPIEIQAITEAVNKFSNKKKFIPIGSLKTNYSHLGSCAGISSVIKGIVSYKYNAKYPLRTLEKTNSLINFDNSPVYPITTLESWNDDRKYYVISSFGISGTNVHLVLEPPPKNINVENSSGEELVVISASSEDLLKEYRKKLLRELPLDRNIHDIAITLNTGRTLYPYRCSAIINSISDFKEFLSNDESLNVTNKKHKIVLMVSPNRLCSQDEFNLLLNKYTILRQEYDYLINKIDTNCKYKDILLMGGTILNSIKRLLNCDIEIVGTGASNAIIDYIEDNISINDIDNTDYNVPFLKDDFIQYAKNFTENNNTIFLELGKNGILSDTLKENNIATVLNLFTISNDEISILPTLSTLLKLGVNLNLEQFYTGTEFKRVDLASVPSKKTKCWIKNIVSQESNSSQQNNCIDNTSLSIEEFLSNMWCELIGLDEINPDDDILDLGATSLMFMEAINQIEDFTNISDLEFDLFYDYSTISELTEYFNQLLEDTNIDIQHTQVDLPINTHKSNGKKNIVLSYNQRQMLMFLESASQKFAYNQPITMNINGDLKVSSFIDSIQKIVERHEILHTIYTKVEDTYIPKILNSNEYSLENHFKDYTNLSNSEIFARINLESMREFDITKEIPIRSILIKVKEKSYLWFINIHHIGADGFSAGIFIGDLITFYNNGIPSKLDYQYSDFALEQQSFLNSSKYNQQLDFWCNELKNISGITNFPTDKVRKNIQTFNGKTDYFKIPSELAHKCKKFAKENQITLLMLLETVFSLEMFTFSNVSDFCIGVPYANRPNNNYSNVMGYFANTLVVRHNINPNVSFMEFLNYQKKRISKIYANVEVPFEEVVKSIDFKRNPAYTPIFQHCFVFHNYSQSNEVSLGSCNMREEKLFSFNTSKFEFTMSISDNADDMDGRFEFNTDLFETSFSNKYINLYIELLEYFIDKDNRNLPINHMPSCQANTIFGSNDASDYMF